MSEDLLKILRTYQLASHNLPSLLIYLVSVTILQHRYRPGTVVVHWASAVFANWLSNQARECASPPLRFVSCSMERLSCP